MVLLQSLLTAFYPMTPFFDDSIFWRLFPISSILESLEFRLANILDACRHHQFGHDLHHHGVEHPCLPWKIVSNLGSHWFCLNYYAWRIPRIHSFCPLTSSALLPFLVLTSLIGLQIGCRGKTSGLSFHLQVLFVSLSLILVLYCSCRLEPWEPMLSSVTLASVWWPHLPWTIPRDCELILFISFSFIDFGGRILQKTEWLYRYYSYATLDYFVHAFLLFGFIHSWAIWWILCSSILDLPSRSWAGQSMAPGIVQVFLFESYPSSSDFSHSHLWTYLKSLRGECDQATILHPRQGWSMIHLASLSSWRRQCCCGGILRAHLSLWTWYDGPQIYWRRSRLSRCFGLSEMFPAYLESQ